MDQEGSENRTRNSGRAQASTVFCAASTSKVAALRLVRSCELSKEMGMQKRRRLKPDAVPTLFTRPAVQLPSALSDCDLICQ